MRSALSYQELVDLCAGKLGKVDVACPLCGPGCKDAVNRKRKVLRIWREDRFASYNCARCNEKGGAGDGSRSSVVDLKPRIPKPETRDLDAERKLALAKQIWAASTPLAGTLGESYLIDHRGLLGLDERLELEHCLRWHEGDCMVVARMTAPSNAEITTGIHRTFLNPDGSKLDRKMLGRQGVIRLTPDEDVTHGLGIAEGIEDGLALLLSGWAPIWCVTSAGGIKGFPVLPGIEALTIFADADRTGIEAAQACRTKWLEAGREAVIVPPPEDQQLADREEAFLMAEASK